MLHQLLPSLFFSIALVPGCFPAEQALVSLPGPKKTGGMSIEATLAARRSVRTYSQQSLTISEVAQLLWAAQGVTSTDGKRTAPSAMHRYPLEIAVVVRNVNGLPC